MSMRFLVTVAAGIAIAGGMAKAQAPVSPVNSLPNPYQTIKDWAKLPDGRTWGSTSAVDIDKDGKSIWVSERCGQNSCLDRATGQMSSLAPILKFDASGKLVRSFGAGLLIVPHGIFTDRDGNVWVTDGQDNGPQTPATPGRGGPIGPAPGATKGHQVFKFSPEGKLLMTLGKPGGAVAPDYFYQPNDVLVAPNGDIFVSEGHGAGNNRVLKFSKDGTFIKSWGKPGTGPGEFDVPHALAMDSRGRLFVGDRYNARIQIFDQDGKFLNEFRQFGRPSGMYIDKSDTLYVADSASDAEPRTSDGWKRGIRIGSARDGSVKYFIPDPVEKASITSAAEGVVVDAQGNLYGAEVGPRTLTRYVKK
jgi:sugar lactone lactonase YvrE